MGRNELRSILLMNVGQWSGSAAPLSTENPAEPAHSRYQLQQRVTSDPQCDGQKLLALIP